MAPEPASRSLGGWRRWLWIIHRDVGYFCVALTLVYAASGVAVNHVHDWNANYKVSREDRSFEPIAVSDRDTMVAELVARLNLPGPPKESFRKSPEQVELFYEGWTVSANATAGTATIESTKRRFLLFEANYLHLNRARGIWTWIADGYAVMLAVLALSGMLMPRGKNGLKGRGKWFVLAGLALPALYLLALRLMGTIQD